MEGYNALREALAVVTWYKREFKTLVRTALRGHSELMSQLDFDDTKRNVAHELVNLLQDNEARYGELTLQLLQDISAMERFTDIEGLEEPDRSTRLGTAREAVARLRKATTGLAQAIHDTQQRRTEFKKRYATDITARAKMDEMTSLRGRFIALQQATDGRQERGYAFEKLLTDLFDFYDLEPHLAYTNGTEQIDGSFRLDTDDYIVEAKWRTDKSTRSDADIFATKVRRKGRNVQGLFVAVAGFTQDFINQYEEASPFITMDGADLYLVLDNRLSLPQALASKRRHLSDTGSCFYSLQSALNH